MISRRAFIAGTVVLASAPLSIGAQQRPRIPRIGVLWHAASAEEEGKLFEAMQQGFRDFGYTDGQNIVLEQRFPAEQPERFNSLAAELVRLNVDVLVTSTTMSLLAAQKATSSIPIVFVAVSNPVERKFIASLAHPGGNVTGLCVISQEISAKRLQLLKEAVPAVSSVAVLMDPTYAILNKMQLEPMRAVEHALGVTLSPIEVRGSDQIEPAFLSMIQDHVTAAVVLPSGILFAERAQIAALALKYRLPTISSFMESAEAGGLMSYSPSLRAQMQRVAYYVDRILKGAKPADLPVEQPTKFELIINQTTATALGLKIPYAVLLRADLVD
jgi:putative ABC transport system substrate-binding protein